MFVIKRCWPTSWLEAAGKAGFAIYKGDGEWHFINDKMREMLEVFTEEIIKHQEASNESVRE